ncbi:hypothetical protein RJ640_003513 [Escallonia rubra]|uniref:Uncharacterized protein n=1 Tax=Escallonia rubra TaxID=112253 RepID=A0AA88QQ57_9ASTE|nr:hypothetical protein RJ640_003513 [Escallonia rubra]
MSEVSNQGLLRVLLATPMGMLNANGAVAQGSLYLVITCYAKSLPETPAVLFVLERDPHVALSVRERDFVQSGWRTLKLPSSTLPIKS